MDVGRHPNIRLLAYSEVEKVEGEVGQFHVSVRRKARYVDEGKCTGCGACAEKCPTTMPDTYNMGYAQAAAIYRFFAQGIPSTYTIDSTVCRNFQEGKKCGVCAKVCQAGAIDYKQQDCMIDLDVGAIIVATGYELFDARRIPEYGYGRLPNVVTALELERFLSASGPTHGHVYRPSDLALKNGLPDLEKAHQKSANALEKFEKQFSMTSDEFFSKYEAGELQGDDYEVWAVQVRQHRALSADVTVKRAAVEAIRGAHRLAFIQCVGSRDIRFNRHCSGFCCMHAIKEAVIAREHDGEAEVVIIGMDIRAVGKGFEEYRNRGEREAGVRFTRSRVAEVTEEKDHSPVIWYEDTKERVVKHIPVDLVILSTACEPSPSTRPLAELLGIEINEFGFFKTNPTLPLDTTRPGVFVCGCAQAPMDIPESVAQSSSAAARAAQAILRVETMRLAS